MIILVFIDNIRSNKLPECRNRSKIYHRKTNITTMSELFQNVIEKQVTTMSKQFQNPIAISQEKAQIHDRPLSWLGTSISINSGGVKLVLRTQTYLFGDCFIVKRQYEHYVTVIHEEKLRWIVHFCDSLIILERLFSNKDQDSEYDIPELVVRIIISMIDDSC